MKCNTIETGAMAATASNSARVSENHIANLPKDFGKS